MRFRGALAIVLVTLALSTQGHGGGPLAVAGTAFNPAVQNKPVVWDSSVVINYWTPSEGGLGRLDNATAVARVQQLFQVWENVTTSNIRFQRVGVIQNTGAYTGGVVNTAAKFEAIEDSCFESFQSPILFDATGSVFTELGVDTDVIGFAGPCAVNTATGRITAARAALNGKWIDNDTANHHLTDNQFAETFVHEFGHFIGLDHSQISLVVLSQQENQCNRSDLEILPLMFPFAHCQARVDEGLPMLAPDDEAWVSMFYPETCPAGSPPSCVRFDSVYGVITGKVVFKDGPNETLAQGFNVLARDTNASRNRTFSVVSGYLFTANPGNQTVTGNNDCDRIPLQDVCDGGFGSHDTALIGVYNVPVRPGTFDVTVEEISEEFTGASSVGPLPPIPLPGSPPAAVSVTVTAGSTPATAPDIELNDQLPRFDVFEGR
jgi:hypothetical protein